MVLSVLEWTRALIAREESWIQAKGFWARKTFCQYGASSCRWSCLLLSCLLLCPLVLSPVAWPRGAPETLLGLYWTSLGLPLGLLLGGSWASLWSSWAALGRFWASFGPPGVLTSIGPLLGPTWGALGVLLGLPWTLLGALGPLLAAKDDFSRHLRKPTFF